MRPFCRILDTPTLTRQVQLRRSHACPSRSTAFYSPPFFSPRPSQSRHLRSIYTSKPVPQQSALDPLTILIALTLSVGAGYIAKRFIAPDQPPVEARDRDEKDHIVETVTLDSAYPDMPTTTPPGRPATLTPEQEIKLKEFWIATLDVFGVTHEGTSTHAATSATSTPADDKTKKKSRLSMFGKKHKDEAADTSDAEDKHGQTKEFRQALASQSPEALRDAFWSMVKHDDPDALLLRFLRARKWDVHNALVMLVATMHWRSEEMHLDDDIMFNGESGAMKLAKSNDKDAQGFLDQMTMGKSFLHGVDGEGRPICTVRVKLHKAGEQTEKSLERYTVYTIETARMMLREPVDTATIVFDMTGFSMANMDYTPVKFMIKCFEANYPESLGSVLVYKAPWVFQGIWKIIRGWLDPVVASKVHFCSNVEELSAFIPKNRITKELGGDENWEYKFVEPTEGEDNRMQDKASRDKLENERKGMVVDYERETVAWAKGEGDGSGRAKLRTQLDQNYWTLDPFVRARSLYDRSGVIGAGGRLDFYPSASASTMHAPTQRSGHDDLD